MINLLSDKMWVGWYVPREFVYLIQPLISSFKIQIYNEWRNSLVVAFYLGFLFSRLLTMYNYGWIIIAMNEKGL